MSSIDKLKLTFGAVFTTSWPKLIKDLLSLASGRVVSMLIGIAAFAYLARVLGPKAFGVVEFAIAITAFAAIIIDCGVGAICIRELAKQPGRGGELAAQSTLARLSLALLIVPLVGFAATMASLTPAAVALVWLYALSLFAVPLKQEWVLQGYEKMTQAAIALPIGTATLAGGIFLLIRGAADLVVVGLIEICAVAAVTVYYIAAQYVWAVPFRFHWSPRETLYLLKEGSVVGLSNGLWAFMIYAPMILLANLVGGTETGWLGAAQRIVIAMVTLSFVYYFNLYPVMAKTVETDVKSWQRMMIASSRLIAWGGTGVALVVALFSSEITAIVFGSAYVEAGPVLAILIWVFPMRLLSGHARWSLIASGQQRHLLLGEILGAVTLIVVAVAAIPSLHAKGAALSLCCAILASGVVTEIATHRLIGRLKLLSAVGYPLFAAVLAAAVALFGPADQFINKVLAILVFAAAALLRLRQSIADLGLVASAKSQGQRS